MRILEADFMLSTETLMFQLYVFSVSLDLQIFYRDWSRPQVWKWNKTGVGVYFGPISLALHNYYSLGKEQAQ